MIAHLDTITTRPAFTADYGSIVLSRTVVGAINAIRATGRRVVSTQDVTFVINRNCPARIQFTEAQVAREMKRIAKDYASGYTRRDVRRVVSQDGYWFTI